jgi:hypothetical protein
VAQAKEQHPEPGKLVAAAQEQVRELADFIQRQAVVTLPQGEPVVVAPSPEFYRWAFASMWTPGPVRKQAEPRVLLPHRCGPRMVTRTARRAHAGLQLPDALEHLDSRGLSGHFLHYQRLRQVESKVRKSTFFAPSSFVEGWAHYCEQMMIEAGFRRGDATIKLGQLAEALVRLARFVVAIRLHCEDLSVEQGMRFFRDEAFLEEATARREAERGTFDPTYLVYSVGKLMMLKLRRDYKNNREQVLLARLP